MYSVHFCTDSLIRIKSEVSTIPVKATQMQHAYRLSDLCFWSHLFNASVVLENNLTFGQFIECFMPWQHFFSELCQKEISEYIDELYAPTNEKSDIAKALLSKRQIISRSGHKLQVRIDQQWEVLGESVQETEKVSLHFVAFNVLKGIPFSFDTTHTTLDATDAIFNKKSEYVHTREQYPSYIEEVSDVTFLEVIQGFWQGFPISPTIREQQKKEVLLALQEIEDVSNLIATKEPKVMMAKNALHPLVAQYRKEKEQWEQLLQKIKTQATH